MLVIMVRHGIALDRDEASRRGMLDRDRPLTAKGHARMRRVARGLEKLVPRVSALLTSPLRRAVETAQILQDRFRLRDVRQAPSLLPDAAPAELAEVLAEYDSDATLMLVGHEPHSTAWVSWCLGKEGRPALELKKGGACLLTFDGAPRVAQGTLSWLLTPGILRRS